MITDSTIPTIFYYNRMICCINFTFLKRAPSRPTLLPGAT
uniref:Uncharacterized protein n=2 Tax=Vibrio TaxID=662 RepID=A0A0H4A373_9VIBR|nr:hypothetical protein [Vibrio splendidus]AKN40266.1 hypothetical protein [Vibrio tasmaniensis]